MIHHLRSFLEVLLLTFSSSSTEDVRGAGWALNTAGSTKFGTPFAKPPRLVAGLNKVCDPLEH